MNRSQTRPVPPVRVETRGDMPGGTEEYARTKVLAALGKLREPVLDTRVKLSLASGTSVRQPAVAQVNVDVNGHLVRAQVAADTMPEAIDLLRDRLAGRLARVCDHGRPHRGRVPYDLPRPVTGRRIVRHRSFGLPGRTPAEAVEELEALEYDFHLFTDAVSGVDSVVYRTGAGGYRLARAHGGLPVPLPADHPSGVALEVSGIPAPRMGVEEAAWRLEATGLPFVFFVDIATGRGNLLHHRHDGDYGLITPAA
ncbi:hypothetical protein CUT44_02030 [Streptomyces carminius]|uniref:Sigma 54 modulation/S30EA ribosomal protein C-terminal domain-containing protein n=1 Tax=Streptomyces carminius TaxID=2665496 RepID=A0A2M8MCM5_9ACTN|nr:sigma 54 modulation/S30EA ribosomal C-terminal domain-containing protein [Streptomyces carminius]PJE98115.1 hypothetical protein CUT44_10290 [Streptomyces carminius]PJF01940.1 hypothetical protein CUT44_02030 [Streptomyces carminius]